MNPENSYYFQIFSLHANTEKYKYRKNREQDENKWEEKKRSDCTEDQHKKKREGTEDKRGEEEGV